MDRRNVRRKQRGTILVALGLILIIIAKFLISQDTSPL